MYKFILGHDELQFNHLKTGEIRMTIPAISGRSLAIMSTFIILLFVATEPALAQKFEKIGAGVVGDQRAKMRMVREYMFYFGIFFIILGAITTAFRKHKFALQKRSDTHAAMGPFVMVVGVLLLLPHLFF